MMIDGEFFSIEKSNVGMIFRINQRISFVFISMVLISDIFYVYFRIG